MRDALRRDEPSAAPGLGEATLVEQRQAPRFALLIRAAKLITPAGEFLCVVRDVSESGVNARIFHPLPDCGEMLLELQNGDSHAVNLVWQEEDRAGFRFAQTVAVARLVECPSRFSKRSVRLNIKAAAQVEAAGRSEDVIIHDISQQGAKISCGTRFALDQRVKLSAAGMRETGAKVRWRKDGMCGLVFEDTYQFGELARIARQLQRPAK